MKPDGRSGGLRVARAFCALVAAFRRDGLFCGDARGRMHGFPAANAKGSARRRNASANAQDARATRRSLPRALGVLTP